MLSINICYAQKVLVEKKIIDFCNEKADAVDSLKKVVTKQDSINTKNDRIIKNDSSLIAKHKLDSTYQQGIIANKDSINTTKTEEVKIVTKENKRLKVGLVVETVIFVTCLLLL